MFGYSLKAGAILSENNRKEFLGILLAFSPLNIGMDARNPPFLGILNSFAKLQTNVGILSEQEFRIPRTIQRMKPTEPKF